MIARPAHRLFLRLPAVVAMALVFVWLPAAAEEAVEVGVRYRSQDTVYLDTGTVGGLAEGDRLAVYRAGQRIGELEVAFAAEHSASCRILEETLPIQPGDKAVRVTAGEAEGRPADSPAEDETTAEESETSAASGTVPAPYVRPEVQSRRPIRNRVSGVVEFGWDSFTDNSEAGRDFDRLEARFNLRVRNISGLPLDFRLRLRTQENQRSRAYSDGAPETERRDRFYEASLLYNPERGRFKAQVGRIAVSPFIAVGYLDGIMGQVRIIRGIDVGALFGSQPIFQSDSFAETRGQKYGAYTRFSALRQGGDRPDLEVYVAGIREEGDLDVSREYVSLETHYVPGGRWSLYQRAELDLNNGWREEATGTKTQLSNLALTLNTEISRSSRFSLSYDRWERYVTEETRSVVEEFFDNLLRQGLRARFSYSKPRGLGFSVYAGYRDRQGEDQNTVSFGGALRYANLANLGIALSGDILGYSNPMTEGFVGRIQSSKRFRGGHEVALLIGGRFYSSKLFDTASDRSDQWIRLSGWLELPYHLFAQAEFEYSDGDDIQGQRILLSIGYRI